MTLRLVTTSTHPDLVPSIVDCLRDAFRHAGSPSRDHQIATTLAQPSHAEETFVLLDDDIILGTASLVNHDLPSRPDLTPWLASVLVLPPFRGRGHAAPLIRRVEQAARRSATTLWLYTWSAEPLYAKLGWHPAGPARDDARSLNVTLMSRDLTIPHDP